MQDERIECEAIPGRHVIGACGPASIEDEDESAVQAGLCGPITSPFDGMHQLGEFAGFLYASRRERDAFVSGGLLGEPAWDMLLALFIEGAKGNELSVTTLCVDSCVPYSTALRWIEVLERKDIIARRSDPSDKRRSLVRLTSFGQGMIKGYLSKVLEKWSGMINIDK